MPPADDLEQRARLVVDVLHAEVRLRHLDRALAHGRAALGGRGLGALLQHAPDPQPHLAENQRARGEAVAEPHGDDHHGGIDRALEQRADGQQIAREREHDERRRVDHGRETRDRAALALGERGREIGARGEQAPGRAGP